MVRKDGRAGSAHQSSQEAKRQRENAYTSALSPFSLCMSSGPPAYGMMLSTFTVGLPSLVDPVWEHPHRNPEVRLTDFPITSQCSQSDNQIIITSDFLASPCNLHFFVKSHQGCDNKIDPGWKMRTLVIMIWLFIILVSPWQERNRYGKTRSGFS